MLLHDMEEVSVKSVPLFFFMTHQIPTFLLSFGPYPSPPHPDVDTRTDILMSFSMMVLISIIVSATLSILQILKTH